MKCMFKVLCSLGFALGILLSVMHVSGLSVDATANWSVLGWGLIGFAIGGLVALVIGRLFCGGCEKNEGSCNAGGHHHH